MRGARAKAEEAIEPEAEIDGRQLGSNACQ
jgi:hypothetical protein